MSSGEKSRSRTAEAAAAALAQAASGWPEPPPPYRLTKRERVFWEAIMVARLPQQWAQVDLLAAVQLAHTFHDLNQHHAAMKREGSVVKGDRGAMKINPRARLIEQLVRRSAALIRLLQLHAVATIGEKGKLGGTKGEAERAARAVGAAGEDVEDDADDLLAKPRRLQ